jgi:hypothetical protein
MNVHQLDEFGQPVRGWCFFPSGGLVAGDIMLVQKIALETNEKPTLEVAYPFNIEEPRRRNSRQRRNLQEMLTGRDHYR